MLELITLKHPGEGFLEDGLAEAGGVPEVGVHHRLQLLHHAQPPLHFRQIVGQGVIAENVAIVPELLDEGGGVAHCFKMVCRPQEHRREELPPRQPPELLAGTRQAAFLVQDICS